MTDLITLEEYKEAQGIKSANDDVRIESLITSVSQLVKTYCANSIVDYYTTPFTEVITVDWNTEVLQLTESPVRSVSCVEERNSISEEYKTLEESNYDYYLERSTDSLIRSTGGMGQKAWPKGPGAVRVSYTAGYESTPADLQLAVVDLITYYLKDEHKQRKTLSGATVDNQGTSSQYRNVGFPDHIKRVLDLYKNYF